MFRWITGVAVGAVMLVMAVGCGGGDDSTTEVTRAEFTKQADAVCAEGKDTRKAAFDEYTKEVEAKAKGGQVTNELQRELADVMIQKDLVPSLEEQVEQMEELGVPAADQAKVSKMLKSLSEGTAELEKGGVRKLVGGGKLFIFQEEAEGLGLNCTVF